jgi:hypothetical protein
LLALFRTLEHRFPVTDATQKKRTWVGLACPVCRFVFRVPKDHDGAGVICPACHGHLNIPKAEKAVEPLRRSSGNGSNESPKALAIKPRDQKETKPIAYRPLKESDTLSTSGGSSSQTNHRSSREKQGPRAVPDWESDAAQEKSAPSKSEDANPLAWIVGGSLVGLSVVGIGAWLVMDSLDEKKSADDDVAILPSIAKTIPILQPEDQMTPEEKRTQKEISDTVKAGTRFLTHGGEVVKKFLNAKSSSELEPLVRTPEVTVPRMRAWYATHEWKPPGAQTVAYGGGISVKGLMGMMSVRLNDFSVAQVALENTPSGYLIDWESWVAWSSMDWDKLIEKRPTEPVEVRVTCSFDSYYNREFNDDSQWIAVKLLHPDSERTIYGYIAKDSTFLKRMRGDLRSKGTMMATIKVRYLKNSVADNQVVICEYIQMGWVRPTADKNKVSPNTPDE